MHCDTPARYTHTHTHTHREKSFEGDSTTKDGLDMKFDAFDTGAIETTKASNWGNKRQKKREHRQRRKKK
jgi:hypothetical protein